MAFTGRLNNNKKPNPMVEKVEILLKLTIHFVDGQKETHTEHQCSNWLWSQNRLPKKGPWSHSEINICGGNLPPFLNLEKDFKNWKIDIKYKVKFFPKKIVCPYGISKTITSLHGKGLFHLLSYIEFPLVALQSVKE